MMCRWSLTAVRMRLNRQENFTRMLILMDITLRGKLTGIEAAQVIREKYAIPIIFLTAHSDDLTFQTAIQTEPFGYHYQTL